LLRKIIEVSLLQAGFSFESMTIMTDVEVMEYFSILNVIKEKEQEEIKSKRG